MLKWEIELAGLYFNTDWNDVPKVAVVSNQPEVGPPIVRLRSRNVMHTFTGTMDMTWTEYNERFKPFVMQKLHGGMDTFLFKSLLDDQTYQANINIENGQPYTFKRKSEGLFTVSLSIRYYEVGAIYDA